MDEPSDKLQWCPNGRPLDGTPYQMTNFLACNGNTLGYGYGSGWGIVFNHPNGSLEVFPTQWVVRTSKDHYAVINNEDMPVYERVKEVAKDMPVMAQQSMIRLLGVKGIGKHFTPEVSASGVLQWRYNGANKYRTCVLAVEPNGQVLADIVGTDPNNEDYFGGISTCFEEVYKTHVETFLAREFYKKL